MAYAQVKNMLQTWKIAAFLVAFFSSFFAFSQDAQVIELDRTDPKPPKMDGSVTVECLDAYSNVIFGKVTSTLDATVDEDLNNCHSVAEPIFLGRPIANDCPIESSTWSTPSTFAVTHFYGYFCNPYTTTSNHKVKLGEKKQEESTTCPPDGFPKHIYGNDNDNDGKIDVCYKKADECPDGYLFKKIYVDNVLQCVPITCDTAGTQKDRWVTKANIYNAGAQSGTYCDGSCAYSVGGYQNENNYKKNFTVTTVSTGMSCGNGNDDPWFHEGEEGCTTSDVGTGTPRLACQNEQDPDPEEPNDGRDDEEVPPVNLIEEMEDLIDIPQLPPELQETCDPLDPACAIRNLEKKLESEGTETKIQEVKIHNQNVVAMQKSTNHIVDGIKQATENATQRNSDGLTMIGKAIEDLSKAIGDQNTTGGNGDGDGDGGDDNYTTSTGAIDKSLFNSLFDATQVTQTQADIEQLKLDITAFINQSKSEAQALVTLSSMGGSYTPRPLEIKGQTLDLSLGRFESFFQALSGPILFICAILAAFIILRSNN